MATQATTADGVLDGGPRLGRRWPWTARTVAMGLAAGLLALLAGDGIGRGANQVQGIDPLDILNLQVRPNIVFVVDTSRSMGTPPDDMTIQVGGDDSQSRLYQVKVALRQAIAENAGNANFGIVDMSSNLANVSVKNTSGPLLYVSTDPSASLWASRFTTDPPKHTANHSNACNSGSCNAIDNEVFDSFSNASIGTDYFGRHYIRSADFRTNVLYEWDFTSGRLLNEIDTSYRCDANLAPAGLLGDDTATANDGAETRPCFAFRDKDTGRVTPFYYSSPDLASAAADNGVVVSVPACSSPDNSAALAAALSLGFPLSSAGNPNALSTGADPLAVSDPRGGLQLGPGTRTLDTALAAAQTHINSLTSVTGQANFIILITGDDWTAAKGGDGTSPVSRISTMYSAARRIQTVVVPFNADAGLNMATLNILQNAGSGGTCTDTGCTLAGGREIAYRAGDAEAVRRQVDVAISEAIASGTFSTESSITESIYEYAGVSAVDPASPTDRYSTRVPVLLQSSFDMPGFVGHLKAFRFAATAADCPAPGVFLGSNLCQLWDAGTKLRDRLWVGTGSRAGMCPGATSYSACLAAHAGALDASRFYTFGELHGSTEPTSPLFAPASDARLHRRVFTTSRNGVFAYPASFGEPFGPSAAQTPVPLWPPTTTGTGAVAPSDTTSYPAGVVDAGLGISALTFDDLVSRFGVCLGVGAPAACTFDPANPTIQTLHARKEAREMILAWMAGAQVVQAADGLPRRVASGASAGELLYQARSWLLAESTLAVPAVVPPPLEARPTLHTAEYLLFRDGIRDNSGAVTATDGRQQTASGLGLRNPDTGNSPTTLAADATFKPLMSVVYHASNDMLHAFRAAPSCPPATNISPTCGSTGDTGGEELWGYVPFDQLGKLAERLQGHGRNPHVYMLASSVRFTDVFVPAGTPFTITGTGSGSAARTFQGRWRTMMLIGRGIAGKYYTALDITAAGAFNLTALQTQPPIPMWSRGNPDTVDGDPAGTANSTTAAGDNGATDLSSYATMGETWSVPAIASMPQTPNFGKEFGVFGGSGYSPGQVSTEGKTFYVMDALSGDILHAKAVPDAADCATPGTCVPNALVANAAAYVAVQLAPGFVGNPSASTASMVYIGDLHGRMWKYITSSPSVGMVLLKDAGAVVGRNQAIGAAAGLLNVSNKPHVYFETGNDLRVNVPPNFSMFGVRDDLADTSPFCDNTTDANIVCAGNYAFPVLFQFGFDSTTVTGQDFSGYRGTAQPATAFNGSQLGRTFFIGTKLTDVPANCNGRFDSVLFAVGAVSGNAVFDLDGTGGITASDRAARISGKVNALRGALGQIVLDKGDLGASLPKAPPAPAAVSSVNEGSSGEVLIQRIKAGSPVCR